MKPLLQSIIPFSHVEPRTYEIVTYYYPLSLPLTHAIKLYAHYIPFVEWESSSLTHRHVIYILIIFLVIAVAQTKIAVFLGLDNGYSKLLACYSQTSSEP